MLQCLSASAGPELQHAREVGAALRHIGDQLDGDYHLQTYDHFDALCYVRFALLSLNVLVNRRYVTKELSKVA